MKEVWDNTMGRANLTFDKKSFVWPIYEAIRAQGIADEEINKGYRAYNYQHERIEIDGKKLWKGKNELRDVGGDLTDLEVLEYAFDNYKRYKDLILKATGYDAPWDLQGRLSDPIGKIVTDAKGNARQAIRRLFDYFYNDISGIRFCDFQKCQFESSAAETLERQCGDSSEGAWLLGGMLYAMRERIPELEFSFTRVAFKPQNPIPTYLNHDAIAVYLKDGTRILDPKHGDINMLGLYKTLKADRLEISPRQAFAHYLNNMAWEYADAGEHSKAIEIAQIARLIDPTDPESLAIHGFALHSRDGNDVYTEALELMADAWKENKDNPIYHRLLGKLALNIPTKQQLKMAETMFKRITDRDDQDYDAYFGLGIVMIFTGRDSEARRCFLRALEIKPDFKMARMYLQEVELKLKENGQ